MAKYVGKIFKVDNKKLGLRESRTHFVYVQWYDQKNKNFRCRVISSLEKERVFEKNDPDRYLINKTPYHRNKDGSFCLFKKDHYNDLRKGNIEPIPMGDLENATHWYGFTKTVILNKDDFKRQNNGLKYTKKRRK